MDSLNYWKSMVGKEYPNIKKFTVMQQLIDYSYETFKNDIGFSWLNKSVTYEEFYKDIRKTRTLLVKKGIKKGDNVAMVFKNEYNFVKSFFAITTLGACAVIVPSILPTPAYIGSFKKFNVTAIIYGDCLDASINEIKTAIPNLPYISYTELENLSDIETECDKTVKPEDPACIIFTGGTTGTPKGAVLSNRALLRGGYNGVFSPGQVFKNKYMALIPFFHVFGLVRNLLSSINSGSNLYLVKGMMRFVKEIKDCAPNIMVVVPALANLLYSIIAQHGIEAVGGKLKIIIAGGAHVTPESVRRLKSVGVTLMPGYGMTETANLTTGNINQDEKPESVGIPYPEQEVKLVDGEIWIKGDNTFTCYYNNPEETNLVKTKDGYVKSGDLGRFDDEGFLYIVGRNKNIIVLDNGENISPELIEDKLDNVPLINSSLIYEDKNAQGRGIIAVKIFPNYPVLQKLGYADAEKAMNDIVDKVNNQLPAYMRISKVTVLKEDFKRSGALKIIRKANI